MIDTYSGATLKAQAGTLERHVDLLDVSDAEKKKMKAPVPTTQGTVRSKSFQKAMAESLAKADGAFPAKSDDMVKACMMRAELEVEARKREVDMTGVGAGLADLRKAILGASKGSKRKKKDAVVTPKAKTVEAATPSRRQRVKAKTAEVFKAKAITGCREDDDDTLEYEVWWEPCAENDFDDDERTWEKEDCSRVEGGMERLVTKYYDKMSKVRESRGNKTKATRGSSAKGMQAAKRGRAEGRAKGTAEEEEEEEEGSEGEEEEMGEEREDVGGSKAKVAKVARAAKGAKGAKRVASAKGAKRTRSEGGAKRKGGEKAAEGSEAKGRVDEEEGEEEEGDTEVESSEEEEGSKRRKVDGLERALTLLSKVTQQLTERQLSMEEVQETTTRLWEHRSKGGEAGGSKGGSAKELLETGESGGTLGLLKRWEKARGKPGKFRKWVKRQEFSSAVRVQGYGEEGRRLNDLIKQQKRAKNAMVEAKERAEEKPDDIRMEMLAEAEEKHWVGVLEEMMMAFEVVKVLKEGDSRGAKHMEDVFAERRYGTAEEEVMKEIRKEADKRSKKEMAREQSALVANMRAQRVKGGEEEPAKGGRRRREEEQEVDTRAPGRPRRVEEEDVRRHSSVEWRKAEEVFKEVPGWLAGKWVMARKEGERGLFKDVNMQDVKGGRKSVGFRGTCMECGEQGHKAVECPKGDYSRNGKDCVTCYKLYEKRMVDKFGVATR